MASTIRVAVLGTGSLGKEHARIYAELAAAGEISFAGVFDLHAETAQRISDKFRVPRFASIEEAAQESDALNIVTPTSSHFEIARKLLPLGKHLLVEKPMTDHA